ncbi:hypothetical protein V6N11_078243 [Hibiscus sabdariffa]|uniref:Uncharacterized protein n=1 Tax=Hibiscus sabdariffa TaxID=183260 RepID=A0ABR2TFG2_9ROSI
MLWREIHSCLTSPLQSPLPSVVVSASHQHDQTRMGFRGNNSSPFSAAASSVQQIVTIIMLTSASFPHCLESGMMDGLLELRDAV